MLKGCEVYKKKEGNLTLVELDGIEYYLCDDDLYLLLKFTDADHYFSPASCTFG